MQHALTDPLIDDIVIVDDKSIDNSYTLLHSHFSGVEKVRLIQQAQNRNMSYNKASAISFAKNDWVLILDSDNSFDHRYLAALPEELHPDTIYCPSFAKPHFNFKQYEGLLFDKRNIRPFLNDPPFSALINCCNYVVHKHTYAQVYEENPAMKASDTIWMAYLWLKAGNSFFVVPGMEYEHLVHKASGFLKDADYNFKKAEEIKKMIAKL